MTRLPRPDFLAAAPRPGLLAWAAAGTGALVLVLGVADVMGMRARIADQHVQLAAAEASAQSAPTRAVRDRSDRSDRSDARDARDATDRRDPRAPNAAAPDMRAAVAEARVLRRLGHPWQQLFTTLEEATPAGVQWLALDHGTDQADLRLAGAARDAAQAVALVDALAAWAGWSDVVLRKLALSDARGAGAVNTASMASTLVQFEMEAQFDAPGRPAITAAPSEPLPLSPPLPLPLPPQRTPAAT